MEPIQSSICIGSDTNLIYGSEIFDPTCRDIRSMSHVCADVWKSFTVETMQSKTAKCNINTTATINYLKKHHVKEHKEFLARGQKDKRSRQESHL